jgi:large subunit ribosomal protein L7/L12
LIEAVSATTQDSELKEEPVQKAQSVFKVILQSFTPVSKAKVIKEIKMLIPNINLVDVFYSYSRQRSL